MPAWLYVAYASAFCAAFAYLSLRHLPFIKTKFNEHKADIALVGAISLFFILLNGELLFDTLYIPRHDNMKNDYPFFHHMIDTLVQDGTLPYWQPYAGGGQPTFIYLNNMFLLHLPHLISYVLFPFYAKSALTISIFWRMVILENLAFSLGVYLMLRAMLKDRFAALFGFAVCLLSGITVGTLHQEQLMASIFYIPWVGLCMTRFMRGGTLAWGILGGLLLGLSLLSHYPQLVAYFWGVTLLSHAVFNMREFRGMPGKRLLLVALVLVPFVGFDALMMFQYVGRITSPLRYGAASGVEYSYSMLTAPAMSVSSLHPHTVLHYLFPETFHTMSTTDSLSFSKDMTGVALGQWKLDNLIFYIGLIPLFFVVYALIKVQSRMLKSLLLASALMLILALGANSFGYFLLYRYVPLSSFQRIPLHLANYINLYLVIIASMGFKAFMDKGQR